MFDFGQRLRELREQRHLSQEAMGKIIGRSKPVVSSYENNLKLPSRHNHCVLLNGSFRKRNSKRQ